VRKLVGVVSFGPLKWPPLVTLPSMVIGPLSVALTFPRVWMRPFPRGPRAVRIVIGLGMLMPSVSRTRPTEDPPVAGSRNSTFVAAPSALLLPRIRSEIGVVAVPGAVLLV